MKKIFKCCICFLLTVTLLLSGTMQYAVRTSAKEYDIVTFNGHNYRLFDVPMTWPEAESYCKQLGGHLATITSQEEQDFITSVIASASTKRYIRLGGFKKDDVFEWVTGEAFSYTNWNTGEPNGGKIEESLMLYTQRDSHPAGSWNDTISTESSVSYNLVDFDFICEWDNTTETATCGSMEFNVVNASTREPISGANILISTKAGEYKLTTNSEGKASGVLPLGDYTAQVYSGNTLSRNINFSIKEGKNTIPAVGLSNKPTVEGKLTVTEMNYEEIIAAGIDTSSPDNNHVYKYEAQMEFTAGWELITVPIIYYKNESGECAGGSVNGSSFSGGSTGGDSNSSPKVTVTVGSQPVTIYPISEKFYLIIYGEVKWLKEMFDVELLVLNNSNTDTIANCSAELQLPEGLSLTGISSMVQGTASISEGASHSFHWYVRGDKEGVYNIGAKLTGTTMPFNENFSYTYSAESPIKVYAGSALQMNIIAPDACYHGEPYTVRIEIENVSDKPVYNLSHKINSMEQWESITYGKNGEQLTLLGTNEGGIFGTAVLHPGEKLTVNLTTNILFYSILEDIKENLSTIGDLCGIVANIPQLAPLKLVSTAMGIVTCIDVRYYLSGIMVNTLEGSTTSIPTNTVIEHVAYPTIFEKCAEYFTDEIIDNLQGKIIQQVTGIDDGLVEDSISYIIDNMKKEFEVIPKNENAVTSAWIENASGTTEIPVLKKTGTSEVFTLSTENETAQWIDGKLTFTGNAELTVTANGIGEGVLCADFGDGLIKKIRLRSVEQHECASESWSLELRPTKEHDGYKALYCDTCDKLLNAQLVHYGEVDPVPPATRIAGRSRFDTAIAISNEGWESAETVILANAMNYADALAGVPYAGAIDAPVLLTAGGGELEASVLAQIEKLGAKNIVILGGKLAVSEDIETALSSNYAVERISGSSRYATSLMIAQKLNANPEQAIIVTGTGYADALSVSPYAAMEGIPILYANPATGLTEEMLAYLANAQDITIIGGEKAVTPVTVSQLSGKNITRIAGRSRYLTSYEIAKEFSSFFGNDVMLATGTNFPDALAGGVLAAKLKTPLLLTDKTAVIAETQEYILSKNSNNVYILGGENAVPAKLVEDIFTK